jgi:hypothetical protein
MFCGHSLILEGGICKFTEFLCAKEEPVPVVESSLSWFEALAGDI